MAEERELILKLGKKITDRIPYKLGMEKLTVNDPEYWGLAGVVTDEMAEVALCMDVRKPITLPKLAKKTKKPEAELEKLLQEMAVVGIIEYNWENPAAGEAVHSADVCTGKRRVHGNEQRAGGKAHRGR